MELALKIGWLVPLLLVACDSDAVTRPDSGAEDAGSVACAASALEEDLGGAGGPGLAFQGPGVDPATGELVAFDSAIVSTTYLQLRGEPAAQMRFGQLLAPIQAELMTTPGLLAVASGSSATCGTARTLTVWESEAAMMAFVLGDAHLAAVNAVTEVSRGGSITTHWTATDPQGASPEEAARQLSEHSGPQY